jgi:hypothetical protein
MMEVTMTELWLFVWAIGATAYALKRDGDCKNHVQMLHLILENKEARADILAKFDKFKENIHASES